MLLHWCSCRPPPTAVVAVILRLVRGALHRCVFRYDVKEQMDPTGPSGSGAGGGAASYSLRFILRPVASLQGFQSGFLFGPLFI